MAPPEVQLQPLALQPGVVGAGANAFPTAEVSNGGITPQTFEDDADLLFRGELASGDPFDIPDESLCLFAPGFSLPGPV